ncbi:nitrate reductase [Beggiatoa leptomitoformis]|uniref:Molybdopterin-dependent oxidoreductase n=1 Tax=Beggiatoa leptomitoformis TaxID=288004 RepID=A0A2N9YHE7_9GAMM|nr:nitrate reductase [Beggiatoa leptomitoformis]ALG67774.1 molybdopterin-dependent oxidoreductase [Beggiatoa leptomitoformis]AUI69981.1 molybdopterin-dependent oxidoreductase [Beggiatoa leptomitoformis]
MTDSTTQTTCPYCGVGCGVVATQEGDKITVKGDKTHPANFGRLCSKGAALAETLDLEGRLLHPEIYGQVTDWETALNTTATALNDIIQKYGNSAIGFYVSGQLLTEDYYVANKLMKGYIGTANIDSNSRLCMASSVAGHKRAFGSDTVPVDYSDLEKADLIVIVGSNLAWCHPVLFQRISAARQQRNDKLKIVVIDPRRTATCDIADLHLPIKTGVDVTLFNGLLHHLRAHDHLDYRFIEQSTQGFANALQTAKETANSIPAIAQHCGVSEADIIEFYRLFARTEKVVTLYSQGVNQSSSGTDKVNSIINCHLATGRIGRVGMGPFSITGQPNAMGGREVGALANQLAAHLDFEPEHQAIVQNYWQSPTIALQAGLKAVDMFEAIEKGDIKAVWIMATNPVVSLPNAERIKTALARCELVIISDCVRNNDTVPYAHILLPAQTWGEKEGTVTNSERRISRQRAFLTAPADAKPDWWIISQVAQHMGYQYGFNYQSPADIFREYAGLSGIENNGHRDFDISILSQLSDAEYQTLTPYQWSPRSALQTTAENRPRFFADGRFYTLSGKANFVPVRPIAPKSESNSTFPLILNTGRIRDQWHTMTRTGKTPRLLSHISEPFVDIHPEDAQAFDIKDNELVCLNSALQQIIVRAKLSEGQKRGYLFSPMHWNAQFSAQARVGTLIASHTDPYSGQPEFKHTPVAVSRYQARWYGFLLSKNPLELPPSAGIRYWAKIPQQGFIQYEFAGDDPPENWATWANTYFGADKNWLEFADPAHGRYRCANVQDDLLNICLFISRDMQLPSRIGLSELFNHPLSLTDRLSLLTGQIGKNVAERGDTVCSCFGVGRATIIKTIQEQGINSVTQLGEILKAGTNCGSCIPELKQLVAQHAIKQVA